MHLGRSIRHDDRGFTMIEVLIAAVVLVIGVLAVLSLFLRASASTVVNRQREGATALAREITEGARSVPFDKLVGVTALNARLQQMPGLEDGSGGGGGTYTIVRRGASFTVATSVCTVDDPNDGGGVRPSDVTFCSDSTPAGTADSNPEDYRRVGATVSWRPAGGPTRTTQQSIIINNPGTGAGVKSVVPRGWSAPYEITSTDPTLTLLFETSKVPNVMSWSVDGSPQSATPTQQAGDTTGLLWQVDWPIATLDDGPYLVTADAFDTSGASGPSRTEAITLNRYRARKPTGFAGGRTGSGTVDLEWMPNTERDIIGYEVERTDASGTLSLGTVCSLAQQKLDTSCTDLSLLSGLSLYYRVRAYDSAPTTHAPRAGDWSDPLLVVSTNRPPYAVPSLTQNSSGSGSSAVVTLTWSRPSPEDPDSGDSIAFFRIYRDGTAVANRYDRWYGTGSTLTWKDTRTGGTRHTYYVSAVDTHYGESALTGPVTGP